MRKSADTAPRGRGSRPAEVRLDPLEEAAAALGREVDGSHRIAYQHRTVDRSGPQLDPGPQQSTGILTVAIVLGNLARYGYRDQRWAKYVLFWLGVILSCHAFFALFWAKAYRSLLGSSFEVVCASIVLIMVFLTWHYARRNRLFGGPSSGQ